MFYVPHYLWKIFEDRKVDKVTNGLRGDQQIGQSTALKALYTSNLPGFCVLQGYSGRTLQITNTNSKIGPVNEA